MAKDTRRWDVYSKVCAKLDIPEEDYLDVCWPWTGSRDGGGYGKVKVDGRYVGAHRWLYEFFYGKVPDGLEIDHLCRNRACCNVAHMQPVPHIINCIRGESPAAINARKTHCIRGHEFAGDNLIYRSRREGALARVCRACREQEREARKSSGGKNMGAGSTDTPSTSTN